ncbi:MAG TPA: peptidoglycan-binding domain-containing protein [Verrucomicrobiae bacterium]|nr:peptidoglycan-binding domain-containing protein [Verrucomicrobiae bacterium]
MFKSLSTKFYKSAVAVVALAFATAAISAPGKAAAHGLPPCSPPQPCSPTIMQCEAYRPILQLWVQNQKLCVAALQGFIHNLAAHYYTGPIDGKFGKGTYYAVQAFQDDATIGLEADGIVGTQTWNYIDFLCNFSNENSTPWYACRTDFIMV